MHYHCFRIAQEKPPLRALSGETISRLLAPRARRAIKPLAVLALVLGVVSIANAASLPLSQSFEGFAEGYDITGDADWSGVADAGIVSTDPAAIAALATYTNDVAPFPLPNVTHGKILQVSDALANSVQSATGGVVISEMLVMPAQRDVAPEGSTNYQFACYVNTNDQLVVWHRGASSNEWITLTNGPSIQTGAWSRVAVHQAYASHRYQVVINDGSPISDSRGWSGVAGGSHPGTWFDMVQTNGYMTRLRTQGRLTSYFDDMVFTNRSVSYSGTNFSEALSNDGSIATTNTITLYGDTFTNTTYSAGTHYSTSGVPAGLSVALLYVSPKEIDVTLTGNAVLHTAGDSTSSLGLTLEDAIFTLGNGADVNGSDRSDLAVSFDAPPALSYSSTNFVEDVANDGSIVNDITITLSGETFASPLTAGVHYTTSGVPAGLALLIVRNDATNLTVRLTGNADAHGDAADTSMMLTFADSAFSNVAAANITDSTKNLSVDFADTAALTYSTTTYAETAANDGSISGGTITVTVGTLTGDIGTNYVLGGEVLVSNIPSGLAVSIVKTALNEVTVSFTAPADAHADSDDVGNLTFAFQNTAFSGGDAAAIAGSVRSDLLVDFNDPPVVSYSGTMFSEASNNNGAIGNTLTVTLSGDTFVDDGDFGEGDEYTVANEPDGLTLSVSLDSPTQLTLTLGGMATSHTNGNDVADLTFNLLNAAFTTVAAAYITDASRSDLAVDFDDAPVISYSSTVFSELSNGRIDNTTPIEITISGDTFTGSYNSDFVADGKVTPANVPNGLTLVLTKSNNTKLLASFTGTAAAHADANDVTNLSIVFEDTAFSADADQVTGYSRSDLRIDFNDSTLTINTVPYSESFEDYANGYAMSRIDGWDPDAAGVVTTETAVVSALTNSFSQFPLDAPHAKVLRIGKETTAEIKGGSDSKVYSDMMVYVTARESAPSGSTNYQFAMFVDTNQILNVWHRDTSGGSQTNTWETLEGVTVETSAWHRMTVVKDYTTQKYQLYLDAAASPVDNPTSPDDWFNMVGTANTYMSRVRIIGVTADVPTYLDDLVVTTDKPDYIPLCGSVFRFR